MKHFDFRKWNGGFAPYGYKLVNNELLIAEDEVEIIRIIYDRYIHTGEGLSGVANYLRCTWERLRKHTQVSQTCISKTNLIFFYGRCRVVHLYCTLIAYGSNCTISEKMIDSQV